MCLYLIREASQGKPLYLRKEIFLHGKGLSSKAYAFKESRIGFQRSSPQNNYRRIIAAYIDPGNFCFDTVSFVPKSRSKLSLYCLLGLLNSNLFEWYFRLGSTNSKVNEYQFNNLPCPRFGDIQRPGDSRVLKEAIKTLHGAEVGRTYKIVLPLLENPPFSSVTQQIIEEAVKHIVKIETERGDITRRERSKLHNEAQPYQDFIDRCIYSMAGVEADEAKALEERLAGML